MMGNATKFLPVDEIVRHYKSGKTYEWLAAKYGVCVSTIYTRLCDAGIELRGKPRPRKTVSTVLEWDESILDAEEALDEDETLHNLGLR